jgi:hypothetical protein
MFCHMCGAETEFTCQDCDEPVCEDCAVAMTLQNQIDYTLCQCCYGGREASARLEWLKEDERARAVKAKKDAANAKARATYRKPENVAKRKEAAAKRKKEAAELRLKQMQNAFRIVGDMLRGM